MRLFGRSPPLQAALRTSCPLAATWPRRLSTQQPPPPNVHHDIGGLQALLADSIPAEAPIAPWEVECHALTATLSGDSRLFSTDMLRRQIEAMPLEMQENWGYYEKWSFATALLLREGGHIDASELESELFADDADAKICAAKDAHQRLEAVAASPAGLGRLCGTPRQDEPPSLLRCTWRSKTENRSKSALFKGTSPAFSGNHR